MPGELDGSEKLSREDLAKKLQPELDKLEMSDGTKKHMQHVWDGHLDRLYAEYGKLREAHEQEAHSAQIFSGDLAKMDASGIPFDTKLSFGDFQKAMEKEHPVTPESDEQLKEKNEHIYGLYDAWTKQRNQLITQTSKAINKAQLPSQLPDGLDKKQFARELGDDLF